MIVTHYPIRGTIITPSDEKAENMAASLSVSITTSAGTERNLPVSHLGNNKFSYQYWSSLGDQIEIRPANTGSKAEGFLFYPESQQVTISDAFSCPDEVKVFEARPGLYIEGIIEPEGIPGVEITVKHKSTGLVALQVKSDQAGRYKAGPLYDNIPYSLEAHLEGYYFTTCPTGFKAVELSQISVQAVDQHGERISGVLLSLTGDSAFYKDSDTDESGEGQFNELFPGTYYLRALLKEYSFKPTNIPIELGEGINQMIQVNATRVAYSAFGSVKSLNGDAERNVLISAQSSNGDYEETQTDALGKFRLRGLKPGLEYSFSVKPSEKIERASPSSIPLEIPHTDIFAVDFVAFRESHRVDIFGVVDVADEFLDSLKIELYVHNKKQNQQELLKTISLDCMKSFDFSHLPKEEYTIKLISSLNTNLYDFHVSPVDIDVARLQSEGKLQDNRIFVPLSFRASLHLQPTELANVSFYPLLILSLLFFIFWYRKHLHQYYQARTQPQSVAKPSSWVPHHVTKHHEATQKANRRTN
mmetsp:Transcript_81782/g.122859  ORF Transcript_81782/g.122859 Transcript_81782/m.122859 type:complete len:530 (+) Transcript_81782:1938-3527(+)